LLAEKGFSMTTTRLRRTNVLRIGDRGLRGGQYTTVYCGHSKNEDGRMLDWYQRLTPARHHCSTPEGWVAPLLPRLVLQFEERSRDHGTQDVGQMGLLLEHSLEQQLSFLSRISLSPSAN
jgi:hypothetical protein